MFAEDDLLPLSGVQHLSFCERQCALIHVEGLWADNRLTVEGGQLHRWVHERHEETRGRVRVARGLALRSLRLGLVGRADVVEFRPSGPFPVEYKRGRPKPDPCDEVQLCAQAVCVEEMLELSIPRGALFYGQTRRRHDVTFDTNLRRVTERTAQRLHELIASGTTPPARPGPKCKRCSLRELCLPDGTSRRSASRYFWRALRGMAQEER